MLRHSFRFHSSRAIHRVRSAFTLIELLVVISIIALMIAILMPALGQARMVAQTVKSVTNIKQIVIGVVTYAEDNKTSLPLMLYGYNTPTSTVGPTWASKLYTTGYVNSFDVWWGPLRNNKTVLSIGATTSAGNPDWYYSGYSMNSEASSALHETVPGSGVFGVGTIFYIYGKHPMRLSNTRIPPNDKFMLITEGWHNSTGNQPQRLAGWYSSNPSNIWTLGQANWIPYNYNGLTPRGYLDGHAKAGSTYDLGLNPYVAIAGNASVLTAPSAEYQGTWTYTTNPSCPLAPWYQNWRTTSFY